MIARLSPRLICSHIRAHQSPSIKPYLPSQQTTSWFRSESQSCISELPRRQYLAIRSSSTMATDIPKAEYKQLGRSGLRVSVPILGAMSIGDKRWQQWVIEEDEALPLLKAAYDRGLNTWVRTVRSELFLSSPKT